MPLPHSRKRTHSPPSEGEKSNNLRVAVRVRPENAREREGSKTVVQVLNEHVLVFDPKEEHVPSFGENRRKRMRDLRKRKNKDLKFAFDFVYGPTSTTSDVYEQTTRPVLTGLLDGFNCSVFAYGATGSGKTHTMLGSKDQPGVIYLAMVDLYKYIDEMKDTKTCNVAISYLEVYNESIRDLLMPGGSLPVREDPHNGVVVPGLSLHKPQTAEELLYMLQFGNEHRTQHPTDANAESSRSHAVFQVFIRQKDRTANITTEMKVAKLCLVDLAGSERATVTKNIGSRLREGANINRSLLALGNVINALAENKTKGFIPYRDSKLTRLLKDSLGGNCRTVMIAAISPSTMSYEDSYNTLRYADRAKSIKLDLKKNVLNVDFHVAKYGQIVEELRREIIELKGKLCSFEQGRLQAPISTVPNESYKRWVTEIDGVHRADLIVRSDQLRQDIDLREVQWRIYRRERCLSRLAALSEPATKQDVVKVEGLVQGLQQRAACMKITSDNGRAKVEESNERVHDLQKQLMAETASSVGQLPEVVSLSLQVHSMKAELEGARQQLGYIRKAVRSQERELQHNERLVLQLLKLIKWQHYIIKGHGYMTSDLQAEYDSIQRRAAGLEICWEDQSTETGLTQGYMLADVLNLPSVSTDVSSSSLAAGCSMPSKDDAKTSVPNLRPLSATITKSSRPPICAVTPNKGFHSVLLGADGVPPTKARRMLATITPPARVDSRGQLHTHKPSLNSSSKHMSAKRNIVNSNSSQTQIFTPVCALKPVTSSTTNNNNSRTLCANYRNCTCSLTGSCNSLKNTGNTQLDVSSSDSEELTSSKFSKLNDTITKSKKFSILHTGSGGLTPKANVLHNLNETFELKLPKIAENSPISSVTAGINSSNRSQNCMSSFPTSSENIAREQIRPIDSNQNTNHCTCPTKNPQHSDQNSTFDIDNKYPKTHCDKCTKNRLQTGSVKSPQENDKGDPPNDSDSSTIVNKSSGSLNSTQTTLSDSHNLSDVSQTNTSNTSRNSIATDSFLRISENLSLSSFNDAVSNILSGSSITTQNKSIVLTQSVNTASQSNKTCDSSSTASDPASVETQIDSTKESGDQSQENAEKLKKPCDEPAKGSSQKGRTYADVVQTPSPVRKVLHPVVENTSDNNNTPQSSDSERSSPYDNSDSSLRNDSLSKSSRLSDYESKENTEKLLSKYGLPSLASSSLMNKNKSALSRNESFTPGYMQLTKASFHRIQNTVPPRKSSLSNSGERSDVSSITAFKSSLNIANSKPRTLLSNVRSRSKSASNLLARAAWQN